MHEFFVAEYATVFYCWRGTHRSDAIAWMVASVLNEMKYEDGSL